MKEFIFISIAGILFYTASKIKNYLGEISLEERLKSLNSRDYKVMKNVILMNHKNDRIKIENIIVSRYGVFVLESSSYKGVIIGKERSDTWDQILDNTRIRFPNPIRNNYANVVAVRDIVEDEEIPVVSIITFGVNADLRINLERENVIYAADIMKTLGKYKEEKIDESRMKEIYALLINSQLDHEGGAVKTGNREEDDNGKDSKGENSCPKCGGDLVRRKGKYGYFTGCKNYPQCRYVRTFP